jgi:hypothetical protein
MNLDDFHTRIDGAKTKAGFFLAKRRKDAELYSVLADVLSICEDVERNGLTDAVREDVSRQKANGRNRVYAERQSDVYVIVGRSVFEPEINRAASWRYSACLREAGKRQINSRSLVEWLVNNGGINTLFKGRGVLRDAIATRTLHLNQSVEINKKEPFTITLKMDGRGFFDVIDNQQ